VAAISTDTKTGERWVNGARSGPEDRARTEIGRLLPSAGIVLAVGLTSCVVPTRRILAIQASEAMHADG
jgi:hypothetical protein